MFNPVPSGRLTDAFGWRTWPNGSRDFHSGQDIAAAGGTPILAAHSGVVLRKWWDAYASGAGAGGNMVSVLGDDGYETRYAHMQAPSSLAIGQRVAGGQTMLGRVGSTGASTGNHLHFEALLRGQYVNPLPLIQGASPQPSPTPSNGDEMIRIQSPGRGIALVGPGYYRHLTTDEEVNNSGPMISNHFTGNDRQFDLWVSMSLGGTAANSGADNSVWKFVQDAWKQAHGFFQTLLGREPGVGGSITDAQIETIAKRVNENLAKNEYEVTGTVKRKG